MASVFFMAVSGVMAVMNAVYRFNFVGVGGSCVDGGEGFVVVG